MCMCVSVCVCVGCFLCVVILRVCIHWHAPPRSENDLYLAITKESSIFPSFSASSFDSATSSWFECVQSLIQGPSTPTDAGKSPVIMLYDDVNCPDLAQVDHLLFGQHPICVLVTFESTGDFINVVSSTINHHRHHLFQRHIGYVRENIYNISGLKLFVYFTSLIRFS